MSLNQIFVVAPILWGPFTKSVEVRFNLNMNKSQLFNIKLVPTSPSSLNVGLCPSCFIIVSSYVFTPLHRNPGTIKPINTQQTMRTQGAVEAGAT